MFFKTENQTNDFAKNANEFQRSKFLENIIQENEVKSFHERFKEFYQFSLFVLGILIIYSTITESAFIYSTLIQSTNNVAVSVLAVLLIVTLIESIKFFGGYSLIKLISWGWLKEAIYYRPMLMILGLIVPVMYAGSAFLSVKGTPSTIEFFSRITTKLELKDESLIIAQYDGKIKSLTNDKEKAFVAWKGNQTRKSQELQKQIQVQINNLENQKAESLKEARKSNLYLQNKFSQDTTKRGLFMASFGGYFEAIQIVFLYFLLHFKKSSFIELQTTGAVPKTNTETITEPRVKILDTPIQVTGQKTVQRNKIGFSTSGKISGNSEYSTGNRNKEQNMETEFQFQIPITEIGIKSRIKNVKSRLNTSKWKLRNHEGKPQTHKRNIKRFKAELNLLNEALKSRTKSQGI